MSEFTTTIDAGIGNAMRSHSGARRSTGARLARAGALLVAGLFALHGFAHAVGVAGIFGLGDTPVENTSTLLAASTPGSAAMSALGVLWVVALGLFFFAAAGIVLERSWWLPLAFAATLLSLALCAVWAEAAVVGLVLNIVILIHLVAWMLARRITAQDGHHA